MLSVGIDTSCYTSSIAVMDSQYRLLYDKRIMLEVPSGCRGLRQSDAVFQHMKNISSLMADCFKTIDPADIVCFSVSSKPRNGPDSYMPVFTTGIHAANMAASCLKKPVFQVSHQQNHILAGIWSSKESFTAPFGAYHVSGGTTELLLVTPQEDGELEIRLIGGSNDLKAGQFIDRAGVAMGFGFPCGQEMDNLCAEMETEGVPISAIPVPVYITGSFASFSGPESHIQRIISSEEPDRLKKAALSAGIFDCIAKAIEKTACHAKKEYCFDRLLLIGGVASNKRIKTYLTESRSFQQSGIEPVFAQARHSSDNAVGTAFYGMNKYCCTRNKE